jgi:hypothetical protein
MCINVCIIKFLVCLKRIQYVYYIISKRTYLFVINELHLEPKFREVGQVHFRFSVNGDPIIEIFNCLIHYNNHCGTHKCL